MADRLGDCRCVLFRTGIPPLVGRDPTEDRFYLDRVFPQRRGRDPELATAKGLAGNGQQLNLKKKRKVLECRPFSTPPRYPSGIDESTSATV